MHRTYRSDIGKGVLFILIITLGGVGVLLFLFMDDHQWIGLVPLGLVLGYLAFLYANTRYHLTSENRLKITAGFKQKDIDIFQISSLRPFTGYFNLPNVYALSENRIRVVYGYGNYVDISPQDPEKFISALLSINPHIHRYRSPNA